MRGLFFKVFIIFWIAQSMIFVISTALIVRHHFDRPDVAFDALYNILHPGPLPGATARTPGRAARRAAGYRWQAVA